MKKITVWQCEDWCCEDRPFSERWWNARAEGQGGYESAPTPGAAWRLAQDNLF
jgi:hypothetical protein